MNKYKAICPSIVQAQKINILDLIHLNNDWLVFNFIIYHLKGIFEGFFIKRILLLIKTDKDFYFYSFCSCAIIV